MDEEKVIELDEGWALLQAGIDKLKKILDDPTEPQFKCEDYMKLHRTSYNLCTQKAPEDYSAELHQRCTKALKDYLTLQVLPSLREQRGCYLLKEFVRRWSNHKVMVRWLSRIFEYLDRYYLPSLKLSLKEEGMATFRNLVCDECCSNVREATLSLINQERGGEQIDRGLLRNVVYTFVEVGVGELVYYQEVFENFMIRETSEYYSVEASKWILNGCRSEYMSKAEECLRKEHDRVCYYLHSSTEAKLIETVMDKLLYSQAQFLDDLADDFLRGVTINEMPRMYRLYSQETKGFNILSNFFKQCVVQEGLTIIKEAEEDASNEKVFIKKLIKLHEKYLGYVNDVFVKNPQMHQVLEETFKELCDKKERGSLTAELLAVYFDDILQKGGSEKLSDEDIEERSQEAVKLYSCINNKEIFAESYRKKFAQRMLFDTSVGVEHEKNVLTSVKMLKRGGQSLQRTQYMLKDFTAAMESQSAFTDYLASNTEVSLGIDCNVTDLHGNLWSTHDPDELSLPEEMAKCVEVFNRFYETKTKKKRTWGYSVDTCQVTGKFDAQTVELIMTTYQASVLLLFNRSDRLSFQEIREQLNLSVEKVTRILHSMACATYKILIKKPDTKEIAESDYFEFNSKFKAKTKKIKIPLPIVVGEKTTAQQFEGERKHAIDAALVRIMKVEKELRYEDLIEKCVFQCQDYFEPDVAFIGKRIEALIDREYLESDTDVSELFRYLPEKPIED